MAFLHSKLIMANAGPSVGNGNVSDTGRTSEVEEEAYVEEHVKLVVDFLEHLKTRGDALPPKAKAGYRDLKVYLKDFEKNVEPSGAPRTGGDDGSSVDEHGDGDDQTTSETSRNSHRSRTGSTNRRSGGGKLRRTGFQRITESSSDSSSSRVSPRRRGRVYIKKEKPETVRERWTPTTEILLQKVAEGVDNRKVPDQAPFDDRTGEDLHRYLEKFEEYCRSMYKGSRDLWIGELERHLTGRTLEGFKVTRDVRDTYGRAKKKLLEWHCRSASERKAEYRKEFYQVKYNRKDSLYFHSVRMERLFCLAYPTRKVDSSKTLRSQFVSTLPKGVKNRIEDRIFTFKTEGQPVTWDKIQKCVKACDEAMEEEIRTKGLADADEEIVIHIGREAGEKESKLSNGQGRGIWNSRETSDPGLDAPKVLRGSFPKRPEKSTGWTGSRHSTIPDWAGGTTIKKCYYCNRLGHVSRVCRKRLGQCFKCGATGHQARECTFRVSGRGAARSQSVPPVPRVGQRREKGIRSNSISQQANGSRSAWHTSRERHEHLN